MTREFITNVIKLRCIYGNASRKKLAKIFLSGLYNDAEKTRDLEPWCLYSVPEWLYREMKDLVGNEVNNMFKSMLERIWWLRLNTLKAPEERILRILEEEAVVERDRDLWYLYRVIDVKKPVRLLKAVKLGMAIPQDKASCMVVEALKPRQGDAILDMTAAPGVKTSLIAMLTEGKAKIVATDISKRRVIAMKNLLKKLGALDYIDIVIADSRSPPHNRSFDKILLDAPCSSSGSISKDPAIRLHLLKRGKIEYYSTIQRELLDKALDLAKEVVYATCSILPEEGEEVIESIRNRAKPIDPGINALKGYAKYSVGNSVARLFPHTHMSEGFFIAKLVPMKTI
ncbi:MAG: RsmB/NOP family class I SAM-dependent RNA methyltransferase [Sulfolobales archaeon]